MQSGPPRPGVRHRRRRLDARLAADRLPSRW